MSPHLRGNLEMIATTSRINKTAFLKSLVLLKKFFLKYLRAHFLKIMKKKNFRWNKALSSFCSFSSLSSFLISIQQTLNCDMMEWHVWTDSTFDKNTIYSWLLLLFFKGKEMSLRPFIKKYTAIGLIRPKKSSITAELHKSMGK